MLTYVRIGKVNYTSKEGLGRFDNIGPEWQFQACLAGSLAPILAPDEEPEKMINQALWTFPSWHNHGWRSDGLCERVVFKFVNVPDKLHALLPDRGFYIASLSQRDCHRLRLLAETAIRNHQHPNELLALQDQALADELSLIALRDSKPKPLKGSDSAIRIANMALNWYSDHIRERPSQDDIARAVNVSASYLRRLFHQSMGVSPREAFIRLRLSVAEKMLQIPELTLESIAEQTGFSSAATLSRAITNYYGVGARGIRARLRASEQRHSKHKPY